MIWYSCGTYSEVYAFADDAKFFRHILTLDHSKRLQNAPDVLQNRSKTWLLSLNTKKCKVVLFGRSVDKSYTYAHSVCDDNNNHMIPLERGHEVYVVVLDWICLVYTRYVSHRKIIFQRAYTR